VHNHHHEIWAGDFFTVPTISFATLYAFFVSQARRRIEHIHVTRQSSPEAVYRLWAGRVPRGKTTLFDGDPLT